MIMLSALKQNQSGRIFKEDGEVKTVVYDKMVA